MWCGYLQPAGLRHTPICVAATATEAREGSRHAATAVTPLVTPRDPLLYGSLCVVPPK